ncbi:MAG: hypothetical protein A2551_06945 [Elusimicrobia bacterium RIFOXYD2_FULL_34_30]|nr:MAG: hypothetical protein A2551_06945 [Elusimicrobia bacterium RIFOXYD2_FULL_34_30]
MEKIDIKIGDKTAVGYEIQMQNAMLVLVKAEKGFVMCGYLDIKTAEKLGDAACIVRGVQTVDDLLNAKIVGMTTKAEKFGVKLGITGKEALEKFL